MRQKIFLFLIMSVVAFYATAQRLETNLPPASQVAKEYRPTYRKLVAADQVRREALTRHGFDVILDDIEQVPTLIAEMSATAQTNWGEQILIPAAIRARIAAECVYSVVVKVADTGGKLTHPDLALGQLTGSTYTGETTPEDGNGHSTHCTGVIAAKDIGAAWQLVQKGLLRHKPVKILNNSGGGSFTWFSSALATERASDIQFRQSGTAVIYSGSFGGGTQVVGSVEAELQKSVDAGVYFVFAAGNTGTAVNYPGLSPLSITTASLDQSMVVSSYSSRGPEIANAMPGRSINSTYKDNTYAVLSGTSMATPFLAAASAIALSKWGMAKIPTQAALRAYLQKVATDIPPTGKDDPSGWGVVFIRAILDTAPGGTPPPPPPPDPEPSPKVTAATIVRGGYMMRYSLQGDNTPRLLQIREVHLFVEESTAEKSIDAARDWCNRFFPTHIIADVPNTPTQEGGLLGAGYWSGQFLEYFAKNNGGALQVTKIVAADEIGRVFEVVGFDRAETPGEYGDGRGVRLVKLK